LALGGRLDLERGVKKDKTLVVAITLETGENYVGRMSIDATYEGDLMAKAKGCYHVGRESNNTCNRRAARLPARKKSWA
jgi:hypothetical protein